MVAGPRVSAFTSLLAVSLLAGLLGAPIASAQQSNARLGGRVTMPDGRPAEGVQLALVGHSLETLTVADGTYQLREIPPGPQNIEFSLIGHRTVRIQHDFVSGSFVTRDVQLEVEPIALGPVDARATSRLTPAMQGFYERRERGGGYFYTREDVRKMQARQFTDVLRRVPGASLQQVNGPFGISYVLQFSRTSGLSRACPVLYYMNGTPFPLVADNSINNYVSPDDLDAVEVYTGTARIPAQFNLGRDNARCGVVLIWTLSGRGSQGGS